MKLDQNRICDVCKNKYLPYVYNQIVCSKYCRDQLKGQMAAQKWASKTEKKSHCINGLFLNRSIIRKNYNAWRKNQPCQT